MRLPLGPALVALILALASPAAKTSIFDGKKDGLFDRSEPVELRIDAPLQQLFERGTDNERYTVVATVTLAQPALTLPGELSVRGNTSKRESECTFPKLKLKLTDKPKDGSIFDGIESVKIGTHCGEAQAGELTKRFGRLANETAPWREALVYRMVDAVGVPTLKARPARITYVDKTATGPLVRNAMLLEDDDDMKKRTGAEEEIEEKAFGNARDRFSDADAARLAFAEAMIGNFDWCLKFSPEDTYRCDERRPIWNILALRRDNAVFPVIKDFDLAGPVTGRHAWFDDVYNEAFVPSKSRIEVEVLAQVQRTRSLFDRDVLDRTRRDLVARRRATEQAIATAAIDDEGRDLARKYARAFFDAIGTDAAFYRRVVVRPDTRVYRDAAKSREACGAGDAVPVGTPVNELRRTASMTQVVVLDALWAWAPPSRCEAIRHETVWIESTAIGSDYPGVSQRSR